MTARSALPLAVLLFAATAGAQSSVNVIPLNLPVGGGAFTLGTPTSQQLSVVGVPPSFFTWAVTSGNLPPGLTLESASGMITGTPTQAGAFTFTVTAFSTQFGTGSRQYTVFVSLGPLLSLTPLPHPGTAVGNFYSNQPFQVNGGVPGYTWRFQPGSSAPGLTLDSASGLLSGVPSAGGTFPLVVVVTDASGAQVLDGFDLNVLGIATTSLPNGAIATPYSHSLVAAGGTGTLTWSLQSGALPSGLSLSSQGQITGMPTAAGTFSFQALVIDSATGFGVSKSLSITITSRPTVTTASLPNGMIGISYSPTPLQATGGTPPYTWTATGVLAGMTLNPTTGILSGTPTLAGTSTISVTVTDALQATGTAQLSLTIGTPAISPASLPSGFVGVPYPATPGSSTLTVAGATVTNWTVTAGTGTLPAGLTLNAVTGVISGTPTTAGSSTFTISASISGVSVTKQFTIVISALAITGLPSTGVAATQPAATVALTGGTYPLPITGTMTLAFAPGAGDAKFAVGPPTTATFTIPAGSTQGVFGTASSVPVMIGTVAGTITITTTLRDSAGTPFPPSAQPAPIVITVNPTVPVITNVTPCAVTTSGFSISVTGRSTPRNMTSALFHFEFPTNIPGGSADITVPLTSAFTNWYGSTASNPFGSTFRMTVQFTFTGPPGTTVPFTAVTATLTNSVGTSTPPVAGQPAVATCP